MACLGIEEFHILPLPAAIALAIVRPLAEQDMKMLSGAKKRRNEVLDEIFETLHNLASSLMNTTLLQQAVLVSPNTSSLKINSR
jgi:hypothetical protein